MATTEGSAMSKADQTIGKIKQAAGDLMDDATLRQEGRKQQQRGEAREEHALAEEKANAKQREVDDLERKTK